MKFLAVFISVFFVLQAQALNRGEVFNPSFLPRAIDWQGEPALGGEVLENPLKERAKLNSPPPAAVSHVVLFEDRKPVCVANAVGRPELVPPFMKVAGQEPETSTSVDLPPCDDLQLSILSNKASQALLINGEEPVQVAAEPFLVTMTSLCLYGAIGGIGAQAVRYSLDSQSPFTSSSLAIGVAGTGTVVGTPFLSAMHVHFLNPGGMTWLGGFSITGLCGLWAYHAIGYLTN